MEVATLNRILSSILGFRLIVAWQVVDDSARKAKMKSGRQGGVHFNYFRLLGYVPRAPSTALVFLQIRGSDRPDTKSQGTTGEVEAGLSVLRKTFVLHSNSSSLSWRRWPRCTDDWTSTIRIYEFYTG